MADDDVPRPNVSGVSPKEGPPKTKVTLRGENLGHGPEDLLGKVLNCFSMGLLYVMLRLSSQFLATCTCESHCMSSLHLFYTTRSND